MRLSAISRRLGRLEAALVKPAPARCPACTALEPGGAGGLIAAAFVLPLAGDDDPRAHVTCSACARCVVARVQREPGGVRVSECVAAELPV